MANVNGSTATVAVAAPMGTPYGSTGTPVSVQLASSFQGYKSVTATSATMEFEAGQPVQLGLVTLASDRWNQMYPG